MGHAQLVPPETGGTQFVSGSSSGSSGGVVSGDHPQEPAVGAGEMGVAKGDGRSAVTYGVGEGVS